MTFILFRIFSNNEQRKNHYNTNHLLKSNRASFEMGIYSFKKVKLIIKSLNLYFVVGDR